MDSNEFYTLKDLSNMLSISEELANRVLKEEIWDDRHQIDESGNILAYKETIDPLINRYTDYIEIYKISSKHCDELGMAKQTLWQKLIENCSITELPFRGRIKYVNVKEALEYIKRFKNEMQEEQDMLNGYGTLEDIKDAFRRHFLNRVPEKLTDSACISQFTVMNFQPKTRNGVAYFPMEGIACFPDKYYNVEVFDGRTNISENLNSLGYNYFKDNFYTSEECEMLLREINEKFKIQNSKLDFLNIGNNQYKKAQILKKENISLVRTALTLSETYIFKSDFDNALKEIGLYCDRGYLQELIFTAGGTTKISEWESNYFNRRNIIFITKLPLVSQKSIFIKLSDAEQIINNILLEEQISNAATVFERYIALKKAQGLKPIKKIEKTLEIFDNYCADFSRRNRTKASEDGLASYFTEIYSLICFNTKKEITEMNSDELTAWSDLLIQASDHKNKLQLRVQIFLNSLSKKYSLSDVPQVIKPKTEKEEVIPYTKEQYFNLASSLINVFETPELLKNTYNNFSISSSILFVLMHFICGWRTKDIIQKLPKPNFKLIGLNDSDSFIEWLEKGNEFTEKMGIEISNSIEEKISRMREEAGKNEEELFFVIPNYIKRHFGLIICIAESNRKSLNKNYQSIIQSSDGTRSERISKNFKLATGGEDINIILGDIFSNRRAIKSYMEFVCNKGAKIGHAFGYYYASIVRSHKMKRNGLAEVTKKYLVADIDTASVEAFITGTFGYAKYKLLSLVDPDFNSKDRYEKMLSVAELEFTPGELEQSLKTITNKAARIDKFLDAKLNSREKVEMFLKELIQGENCVGKHRESRCLFKAIKNVDNTLEGIVNVPNINCPNCGKSCEGCDYFIGLRYFIYEFEKRFNEVLTQLEQANSKTDIEIHVHRIKEFYAPIIVEMQESYGKDAVNEIFNIQRYLDINANIQRRLVNASL